MCRYTIQIDPPIALELWRPQHHGDVPRWHFSVDAPSPAAALEIVQGHYEGMPMRIVPPLG